MSGAAVVERPTDGGGETMPMPPSGEADTRAALDRRAEGGRRPHASSCANRAASAARRASRWSTSACFGVGGARRPAMLTRNRRAAADDPAAERFT